MKKKVCGFFSLLLVFAIFVFSVSCQFFTKNIEETLQIHSLCPYTFFQGIDLSK